MRLSRQTENALLALCLALPVGVVAALGVDHITEPQISGTAIVTVEMDVCRNPSIHIDDDVWLTSDRIADDVWIQDADLTARFSWDRDTGRLDTDAGSLDYGRSLARFGPSECRI